MSLIFFEPYLTSLKDAFSTIDLNQVAQAAPSMRKPRSEGGRVFVFGNGESIATGSDFVRDMNKGASLGREERFRGLCNCGNSSNVAKTTGYAREDGCVTMGLTGRDGGQPSRHADCDIHINGQQMGRIEDGHMVACHIPAYFFMDQK